MTLKGILATALVVMFASWGITSSAYADVIIYSTPDGAAVTLEGGTIASGITPARFSQGLAGSYQVTISKSGYETHRSQVLLDPMRPSEINVTLKPKTRFKSTLRSLAIPGWGQRYTERNRKGLAITLLAAGAIGFVLLADDEFWYREGIFDKRLKEYDRVAQSGTIDELRELQPGLDAARKDAYDADKVRRTAIGTLIGVWTWNVLDAYLFFPDRRHDISIKGLSTGSSSEAGVLGLVYTYKF